jgi:saccharopine dehydrogenase-like NADP-dependent oxidoreductase
MKVVVFGVGRVGRAIVRDLAQDDEFTVTAADASQDALDAAMRAGASETVAADFLDTSQIAMLAADHDLVVGAVPGPLGFRALEAMIRAGKSVVDISFFEEDPFDLDELARENEVTALVDCGVAPGLSNMLLGFVEATSDRVERFACYVGGLPVDRGGLFEYKATFSPIDVIAEYTRPARYVESGEIRTVRALSQVERIEFAGVGELEAFLTDGLRTLIRTVPVPDMWEKTVRYPGHAAQMTLLREMGLFGDEQIDVGGVAVRPRDVTARLLFPLWRFEPGEPDLTVMRVVIDSVSDGTTTRFEFDLVDRYDAKTDTPSMARTTGYTCTAMVRLLARGEFARKGICPPEYVGRDASCFESVVADLKVRGVELQESVSRL